jgi:hypothetical protein
MNYFYNLDIYKKQMHILIILNLIKFYNKFIAKNIIYKILYQIIKFFI